jgi:glucose/arabinose dehydrogenase
MSGTRRLIAIAALVLLVAACAPSERSAGDSSDGDAPSQTTLTEKETTAAQETTAEEETTAAKDPVEPEPSGPVEVETSVVATDLEVPWGLAFLPDGDALVTERDSGRLLSVDPSGNVEEVQRLPASGIGEGGLLGIALSPDYEQDGLVYAYYSTAGDNRVVRFRLGERPEPILTGIPVNSYHNGGRIAFGPDGMLYIGTGDAGDTANAQDRDSLGGKILRITPDGGVPEDNPFPGNPAYSYGHRNVQGLAWDEDGQLYASEFGQNLYDEVNRIEPGENYGWPEVEGAGGEPEYTDPISTFTTAEASPSGVEILKGGAIPQWEGDFFMAGLRGERLWRLELTPEGTVAGRDQLLRGEAGRLRHVVQAPDGSLWVLTSNHDGRGIPAPADDRILRLGPTEP